MGRFEARRVGVADPDRFVQLLDAALASLDQPEYPQIQLR